jgi:two-component system sensor histidine kinase ResE
VIRSVFLRRTLLLVLATVLLTAALTGAVYIGFAQDVFARMRAQELAPTAQIVAELVVSTRNGLFPVASLFRLVSDGPEYWGAEIVVYDEAGTEALGLYPTALPANKALLSILRPRVIEVLTGETVIEVQRAIPTRGDVLIVGTPVMENGIVVGAVLLVKPMNELHSALGGLNRTLLLSMLAAFLLMLVPSYLAASKLIGPVRKMQAVADAMARGDFTVRAEENQKGEPGALAGSLNRLSMELSKTIGELVQEKNRLALILDGLAEGIVAMDVNGCVTRMNPAVERLSGPDADPSRDPVDRVPGLRNGLQECVRDGNTTVHEVPIGPQTLRISTSPLFDESGGIVGAVALVRDTTEAARLEKARRDYVSNVSHEFRTPVSSIRGLLEPLRDGLVTAEEDRVRYYSFMMRETERLTRLIDDLLELSRLQSGTVAFEGRTFRLPRMYDEIEERFRKTIAGKGLRLELGSIPQGAPAAFGNPDRAEQVLVALVDNAIKFAKKGGFVRIDTKLDDSRFRITVSDDGPGIPEEALPNVFDRFFKADDGRSGEGSGLGLAIAKEVLQGMGQEIEARNRPEGGAEFIFTLFRADSPDGGNLGVNP